MNYCRLPSLDPWDPSIKRFLNPSKGINDKCNPSVNFVTSLKNGKLTIAKAFLNTTICDYR